MKCWKCGAENAGYSVYCGWCGGDLSQAPMSGEAGPVGAAAKEASPGEASSRGMEPEIRYCTQCGKKVSACSNWCPFCGKRPWGMAIRVWNDGSTWSAYNSEAVYPRQSGSPMVGGILAILAGLLAFIQGIILVMGSTMFAVIGSGSVCFCGTLELVFGFMSMLGGRCAMKSENFTLAIVGAVLGMLAFGFIIGFLLGLLAVIFIAMSHNEFA